MRLFCVQLYKWVSVNNVQGYTGDKMVYYVFSTSTFSLLERIVIYQVLKPSLLGFTLYLSLKC